MTRRRVTRGRVWVRSVSRLASSGWSHGRRESVVHVERLTKPGDREDPQDPGVRTHDAQRNASTDCPLPGPDQHAEPGGVDEGHLAQVQHETRGSLREQVADRLAEPADGGKVDLTGHAEDGDVTRDSGAQGELHAHWPLESTGSADASTGKSTGKAATRRRRRWKSVIPVRSRRRPVLCRLCWA